MSVNIELPQWVWLKTTDGKLRRFYLVGIEEENFVKNKGNGTSSNRNQSLSNGSATRIIRVKLRNDLAKENANGLH